MAGVRASVPRVRRGRPTSGAAPRPAILDALTEGSRTLLRHDCVEAHAGREADDLLAWAMKLPREALFAHPERLLTAPQVRTYRAALRRRLAHEPVEYITGSAAFMGRAFRVTRATLIPRDATETLVEEAIIIARSAAGRSGASRRPDSDMPETASDASGQSRTDVSFIDVGTGSGAIAITLAATFPRSQALATDLSSAALAVARANARQHAANDRIAFVKADLLPMPLPVADGVTIIVANLPYIPSGKMRGLAPEVRDYEPRSALVGGKDGLTPSRRLIDRVAGASFVGPVAVLLELLPEQCAVLETYARRVLTGWETRRVTNAQGVAIGICIASWPA